MYIRFILYVIIEIIEYTRTSECLIRSILVFGYALWEKYEQTPLLNLMCTCTKLINVLVFLEKAYQFSTLLHAITIQNPPFF